jgi:hypothetical protein
MKRFITWLICVILIAAGVYVGLSWSRFDPFKRGVDVAKTPDAVLQRLRKSCASEEDLRGAFVRSIEIADGKLAMRGWMNQPIQKELLEARAVAILDASPDLKAQCPGGVANELTLFVIQEHLMRLQHDFDEAKGADPDDVKDARKRSVMRMTRLDDARFGEDGRLTFTGVCIRGNAKAEDSRVALKDLIKARLEASGVTGDALPEVDVDVRCFTNPAISLQKQLERNDLAKEIRILPAWYDGKGKLHFEGILTRDDQDKLVTEALNAFVKDPDHLVIFRAHGSADEKITFDKRLVILDAETLVPQLQKRLVEHARKNNKPLLRRVKLMAVSAVADTDPKGQAITDDEGNPSHLFLVSSRHLDNGKDDLKIQDELNLWLIQELPAFYNPDRTPLMIAIAPDTKKNLAATLQQRLDERKLNGAVITEVLYDETGKLELIGRLHGPDTDAKQAVEAAFKDLLADESISSSTLKPHETRKDAQPITWTDVVKSVQARLAADGAGKRVRLDRLVYRHDKDGLRLVAEGAFLSELGKDPGKTLAAIVDEIVATRGNIEVSIIDRPLDNPGQP